jgi:hypothetical protein
MNSREVGKGKVALGLLKNQSTKAFGPELAFPDPGVCPVTNRSLFIYARFLSCRLGLALRVCLEIEISSGMARQLRSTFLKN